MRFIYLIVCNLFLCGVEFGQVGTATLSGTVTDPTGSVIQSAEVVLKSSLQQFSRQAVTEAHGEYVIPAIPPGKYELAIRAKGFADETRTDISLDSGQASTLNVIMNVAGTTQQVVVTEAPPLLQTTTATVGTVVADRANSAVAATGSGIYLAAAGGSGCLDRANAEGRTSGRYHRREQRDYQSFRRNQSLD